MSNALRFPRNSPTRVALFSLSFSMLAPGITVAQPFNPVALGAPPFMIPNTAGSVLLGPGLYNPLGSSLYNPRFSGDYLRPYYRFSYPRFPGCGCG